MKQIRLEKRGFPNGAEGIVRIPFTMDALARVKTKWGSCNHYARTIRLNTDLAKKPPECLEYIIVHEMVHLLEPTHNWRNIFIICDL